MKKNNKYEITLNGLSGEMLVQGKVLEIGEFMFTLKTEGQRYELPLSKVKSFKQV